jgi:hypothetical protein
MKLLWDTRGCYQRMSQQFLVCTKCSHKYIDWIRKEVIKEGSKVLKRTFERKLAEYNQKKKHKMGGHLAHEAGPGLAALIFKGAFTANPGGWGHGDFGRSGIVVCTSQNFLCDKRYDSCIHVGDIVCTSTKDVIFACIGDRVRTLLVLIPTYM